MSALLQAAVVLFFGGLGLLAFVGSFLVLKCIASDTRRIFRRGY
jgi:hypothetical protein